MSSEPIEFEFFVYDDSEEDPRFSFWAQRGDVGFCLYDRPPEGAGMWLDPDRDSDYEPTRPTRELKEVVADLLGDGLDPSKLVELPPHERYFAQVLHGTNEQNPGGIPETVWDWMHECEREVADAAE